MVSIIRAVNLIEKLSSNWHFYTAGLSGLGWKIVFMIISITMMAQLQIWPHKRYSDIGHSQRPELLVSKSREPRPWLSGPLRLSGEGQQGNRGSLGGIRRHQHCSLHSPVKLSENNQTWETLSCSVVAGNLSVRCILKIRNISLAIFIPTWKARITSSAKD